VKRYYQRKRCEALWRECARVFYAGEWQRAAGALLMRERSMRRRYVRDAVRERAYGVLFFMRVEREGEGEREPLPVILPPTRCGHRGRRQVTRV